MKNKTLKSVLKKDGEPMGYSWKTAETLNADQLLSEDVLKMKRQLGKNYQSASFCCEAAGSLSVKEFPTEDAY